ncbi:hypothetical protein PENTCL1PPCAC_20662, partial [Pristionchus entomophagus]
RLHANLIVMEGTFEEDLDDERKIIHVPTTKFHANCMDNKCIELTRKLRKTGVKSKKASVKCNLYSMDDRNNLTCRGDFCYYQYQWGAVTRGCYTVDDSLAERKLTV